MAAKTSPHLHSKVTGTPDSGYSGCEGTITRVSADGGDAFVEWTKHPDPAVIGTWVATGNLCSA